jgi:uncharacterized protein YuzE
MKRITKKRLASAVKMTRDFVRLPVRQMAVDYDEGADVLYLSFTRPQDATNSEMRDDGIIVSRRGKEIVGLTILDASTR